MSDGYAGVGGVLTSAECDALLARLGAHDVARTRAGARHLMSVPEVNELATRLRALAGGAVPFRATLFDKSPEANWAVVWHQDTALPLRARFDAPGWGPWSEKGGVLYAHAPASALERVIALRVHLDASTHDNGPLRVVPGSHRRGVLTDDEVGEVVRASQPAECLAPRGGVVIMRPLLIHASAKATSDAPRRVLHIEYAESLQLGDGIELAIA